MRALIRIATAAAILGVGWAAAQSVRGLDAYARDNASRLGFEMMGIQVGLVAIAISFAWLLPGRTRDRLGLGPSVLPWGAIAAIALGTLGLSVAINGFLDLTRVHEGSVMVGISRGTRDAIGWGFAIALFGSALAPAIGEEVLCRGLVQRTLARGAGPLVAIVTSSLLFGWLHMELIHGAVAACIGLYLGLAAWWGNSTRPAMVGHAVNNVAALLASKGLFGLRAPIPLLIGGGLLLALGGLVVARRARRRATGAPPGGGAPGAALQPGAESADS